MYLFYSWILNQNYYNNAHLNILNEYTHIITVIKCSYYELIFSGQTGSDSYAN